MKNNKKVLFLLIFFLLSLVNYSLVNARSYWRVRDLWNDYVVRPISSRVNEYVAPDNTATDTVAESYEWVITVKCSDFPWQSTITLEVNWVSETINCKVPDPVKPTWWSVTPLPDPVAPDPIIPDPVITTNTTTTYWWTCSSYISDWEENWSNCEINSNWTSNWTINCEQINTWSSVSTSCWKNETTTTTTYTDWLVTWTTSSTSCDISTCPSNVIRPSNVTEDKIITAQIDNISSQCNWTAYADNLETCDLRLNISWTTNQGKAITWLSWKSITNITDISNFSSDLINNSWVALNFENVNNTTIQWSWTDFYVDINWIKSRTPLVKNNWKISLKLQWISSYTTLNLSNIFYNFKKPFTWILKVSDDNWNTWNAQPSLWTKQLYNLWLEQESSLVWNNLFNYSLDDFTNKVEPISSWLELQDIVLSWSTLNSDNWTLFEARINTSVDATQLDKPWIQVNKPIINYELDWENVSYYLSDWVEWNDSTPIKSEWDEFLWVEVIWTLQWDGKSEFTGQESNFSDLSKSDVRVAIRKNAYYLIKGMTSWQISSGIKYLEWDINFSEIGDLEGIETLIIKDWNLIVDQNVNEEWKKLWIIILKDNYNINSDYDISWNVYVSSWVDYINAIIYADWWLISADLYWNPYTNDSLIRTNNLKNQLILKWSLFTRNTIGWAILAWGYYLLPGWEQTNDFNKAMIYDLNYIRRWNNWCEDNNADWTCDLYNNPFVIIYNPSIQTNPPVWFDE